MTIASYQKKKKTSLRARSNMIFYCSMMAVPVIQFCIFYIGVNANSILLSFQSYTGDGAFVWQGFDNLKLVWFNLFNEKVMQVSLDNSILVYAINMLLGTTLSLLFSYYIYKGFLLNGLFRILLFIPSIISSIVMVMLYQYFVELAVPDIIKAIFNIEIQGLLSNQSTTFATLVVHNILMNFGMTVLIYVGAMSSLSTEIVEAADIEGAGFFRQFWSITLPLIFPTITTFVVVGVATLFTNQIHLFSFYGPDAEFRLYTFGYYLYRNTQSAGFAEYPYLAGMGIMLTLFAVPLALGVMALMKKLGPSEE